MTRQAEAEIEILVCTPAAGELRETARESERESERKSNRRQDARYRRLAWAYQNFARQPATRIDITSSSFTSLATSVATSFKSSEARQPDTTAPPPGSALSAQFWSLSFESVCDNVQSPRVRHAVVEAEAEAELETVNIPPSAKLIVSKIQPRIVSKRHSYVSPDDYIPDSQPDSQPPEPAARKRQRRILDDIETSSDDFEETRILESQDLGVLDDIEDVEDVDDRPQPGSPDLSAMPLDDPLEDSLIEDGSQELPQQPTRQPLSQRPANSQSQSQSQQQDCIPSSLPEETGKTVASPTKSSPCKPTPLPVPTSASVIMSPKRRWIDKRQPRYQHYRVDEIEDVEDVFPTPIEIIVPETSEIIESSAIETTEIIEISEISEIDTTSESDITSSPVYALHDTHLRVIPPEPPIGCGHLDAASLITERLAGLARTLNLQDRFTKFAVWANNFGNNPFNRGYWTVDTTSWPPAERQKTWKFLADYVSSGGAGWSVWCSRRREAGPLRLHCFEATAGHLYLLLYLASKRKILNTGAVWMDAAGLPVITMPPRKRRDDSSRPSSRATMDASTLTTV